jgi:hypothetical protein
MHYTTDDFYSDSSDAEDDKAKYMLPLLVDDNSKDMELEQELEDTSATPSADKLVHLASALPQQAQPRPHLPTREHAAWCHPP